MSAQDLADACDNLDHPIPRNVIANLESGRRSGLTVADLLVLAEALHVPPLWLLFPLDRPAQMDALPGNDMDPWRAFAWFAGEAGIPSYANVLSLYRRHEKSHSVLLNAFYQDWFETSPDAENTTEPGWRSNNRAAKAIDDLREIRLLMRARHLLPPELPPQFSFVDEAQTGNPKEETT